MKNNTDVNIGVHYFRHWSGTGNIQIRYIWKGVIKSLQRRLTMILHKQGQPSPTQNESKWRIPSISNHTHMDNLTLLNSNKCIGHSNKERIQLNFVIGVLVHNLIATE